VRLLFIFVVTYSYLIVGYFIILKHLYNYLYFTMKNLTNLTLQSNLNINLSNTSQDKTGNQQGNLTKQIVSSEIKDKLDTKSPNVLYFLGGFVEGEGSNSVSISVGRLFKYGINLQPVFNITQHENGLKILHAYKDLFGAGSVLQKSGSPHIWVYTIKGYKHIITQIFPFLEKYVQPYSCKGHEYQLFKQLVILSSEGNQRNKETLINMVK